MCFHSANNDLVSCGADGTLRRADFDTCVFDEVSLTFFSLINILLQFGITSSKSYSEHCVLLNQTLTIENTFNTAVNFLL